MMPEGDGNQTCTFSFGALSGLNAIENGPPGTQVAANFDCYRKRYIIRCPMNDFSFARHGRIEREFHARKIPYPDWR